MHYYELFEGVVNGTYVSVRYDSETNQRLADFANELSVPNALPPGKYHTTIVYSRRPIPWILAIPGDDARVEFAGWDLFPSHRKADEQCLVMLLKSDYLQSRFNLAMDMGATFDFPVYTPHITISYDVGDFDTEKLSPPSFDLKMSHEQAEPLMGY